MISSLLFDILSHFIFGGGSLPELELELRIAKTSDPHFTDIRVYKRKPLVM